MASDEEIGYNIETMSANSGGGRCGCGGGGTP
jgi:hypothetical protein